MNSQVEQAFVDWLEGLDLGANVYAGSSSEEMDPEVLAVVASVPTLEHPAGAIYKASVDILVMGPAFQGSLATYRTTATEIVRTINSGNLSGLTYALLDAAEMELRGVWVRETGESVAEGFWQYTIRLVCGLRVDEETPPGPAQIDGGSASMLFNESHGIDGGDSNAVFLLTQLIDGEAA